MMNYIKNMHNKLRKSMTNVISHKKLHKSHKQWIVIGLSTLFLLTGSFALSETHASSTINTNKSVVTEPKINNSKKYHTTNTIDKIQTKANDLHSNIISNQISHNKVIRIGASHAKQYSHYKAKLIRLKNKRVNRKHSHKRYNRHINKNIRKHKQNYKVSNDYKEATTKTKSDSLKGVKPLYNEFQRKFKSEAHNKNYSRGVEIEYLFHQSSSDGDPFNPSDFSDPNKFAKDSAGWYVNVMTKLRNKVFPVRKNIFNKSFEEGAYDEDNFIDFLDQDQDTSKPYFKEIAKELKSPHHKDLTAESAEFKGFYHHIPGWRKDAKLNYGYGLNRHQLYKQGYNKAKRYFKLNDPNDYYEDMPKSQAKNNSQQLPKALINSINNARRKNNVSSLSENTSLDKVASMRAEQMNKDNSYGYNSDQTRQDAEQQGITLGNNWIELIDSSNGSKNLFMDRNNYMNAKGIANTKVNQDMSLGRGIYGIDNQDRQTYQQYKQTMLDPNRTQIGTGTYFDKDDQLFLIVYEFE